MYNHYVRDENGNYTRQQATENHHFDNTIITPAEVPPVTPPPAREVPIPPPIQEDINPPPAPRPSEAQLANRLLHKLHLGDIDAGDLLLLVLLFLLFQQKADEEVLLAIGLLLIL